MAHKYCFHRRQHNDGSSSLLLILLCVAVSPILARDWSRSGIGAVQCIAALPHGNESVVVGSSKGVVARLSLKDGALGKYTTRSP